MPIVTIYLQVLIICQQEIFLVFCLCPNIHYRHHIISIVIFVITIIMIVFVFIVLVVIIHLCLCILCHNGYGQNGKCAIGITITKRIQANSIFLFLITKLVMTNLTYLRLEETLFLPLLFQNSILRPIRRIAIYVQVLDKISNINNRKIIYHLII